MEPFHVPDVKHSEHASAVTSGRFYTFFPTTEVEISGSVERLEWMEVRE